MFINVFDSQGRICQVRRSIEEGPKTVYIIEYRDMGLVLEVDERIFYDLPYYLRHKMY